MIPHLTNGITVAILRLIMEFLSRFLIPAPITFFYLAHAERERRSGRSISFRRKVRPEDLRSLKSFGDDYPESRRFLLYRGKERFLRDGILCLPCDQFLLSLRPDKEIAP